MSGPVFRNEASGHKKAFGFFIPQIGNIRRPRDALWKMRKQSVRIPSRSLARPFNCFAGRSVDEVEKAGLLAPRSSYSPRLSTLARSGFIRLSSLVTAAQPPGISSAQN